jgi:F0F1-type ATP synthase membrane subunit b/b'
MPEPNRDDLLGRIESLERANRRWKRLSAGLLAAVVLLLSVVGVFVAHQHARLMAAQQEVERALREAEAEKERAEAERERAERNFRRARQEADEALNRLEQ